MVHYTLTVCSNVQRNRLEVEVKEEGTGRFPQEVALVYKDAGGWQTDCADDTLAEVPDEQFTAALMRARQLLDEYEERNDEKPPEGLTDAGMALWLMQKKTP